ncbi:MAG: DUF262 domain-containing protein [Cyanobacteria bacterium P01_G01_bin.54]
MSETVNPADKTLSLYPIDYPFETLVARINASPKPKTILNPDFQRKYKWDKEGWGRASQFIESCLMRIPLPSCYFAEDENYRQVVIDGVQRLTTITKFFNDEFALEGMTAFKELEGKKFSELGDFKAELESTTIRCIVLRKENPRKLIREIFARLNQGAVQLSDQEIRHAIYPGSLDELLFELAQIPEIASFGIARDSERTRDSREAEEQVLRFLAFSEDIRLENYNNVLKAYLDEYMENHANDPPERIDELRENFKNALSRCKIVFEENLFVSTTQSQRKQGMVYYDLLMHTVGLLDDKIVQKKKDEIKSAYGKLCQDDSFKKALSAGLQQKSSILRRRTLWGNLLNAAISK